MKCPNKSHPLFKAMIEKYGNEEAATRVWVRNNFEFENVLLLSPKLNKLKELGVKHVKDAEILIENLSKIGITPGNSYTAKEFIKKLKVFQTNEFINNILSSLSQIDNSTEIIISEIGEQPQYEALTNKIHLDLYNIAVIRNNNNDARIGTASDQFKPRRMEGAENIDTFFTYVFLHELIHSLTAKQLVLTANSSDRLSQEDKNLFYRLNSIYNEVKDNDIIKHEYGISSLDEFMAEALSNESFAEKLRKIELKEELRYKSNANIFDNIVDYISDYIINLINKITNFFNEDNKTRDNNSYNNILNILSDIISNYNPNISVTREDYVDEEDSVSYFQTENMSHSNSVANTLSLLDYFNKNYRKTASGQYEFVPTGEIRTEKTASQLKTPKFISDDPEFLKMTSEYGSIFGEIYQQLLKQLYEGKELSNNIMIEGKMFPLEDRLFNELAMSARVTYQQLQDKQDRINIIKKTNDKFILRFEQILIDENRMTGKDKGLGGSMDVFVLFSDNSAGVLDVKTIFTKSFIGEDGRIKYFNLNDERKEKYKSQLNAYVEMLKEKVRVKSVDIVRVIPIIAQYDEEEKSVHITTETKEGMSIANIVVGQEKTGIASLDESIQSGLKIIETLEDRLRDLGRAKNNETDAKKKSNYEIEIISIKERLKIHNQSIQEMFLTQDFRLALKAARSLSKEVKRELAKSIQDIDIAKVNESIDELEAAVMLRRVNKELKAYNKDTEEITHSINSLEDTLQELKATRDVISVEYYKLQNLMVNYNKDLRITGEFKNVTGDGWAMRNMANTSDQNNPHIQKLFKAISSTSTKKDFELNAYIALNSF